MPAPGLLGDEPKSYLFFLPLVKKDALVGPKPRTPLWEVFCRTYKCNAVDCRARAFRMCLPKRTWPLVRVLQYLFPGYYDRDEQLIEEIAGATNETEIMACLLEFRTDCEVNKRRFHDRLGIKVIEPLLLNVFRELLKQVPKTDSTVDTRIIQTKTYPTYRISTNPSRPRSTLRVVPRVSPPPPPHNS